ncbi:hypothetical protein ALC57_02877 [Trachymyrmex cornetzi]|uniref:GIY-YIG domain-containing protein n=1 Tax=Trachymyrmex cornetzi TaxID=471704 RepID=A0A195EIT7_9HYME|nr:hypothetical protein ALC57_02877 [Trachymyrmex cornetzi]
MRWKKKNFINDLSYKKLPCNEGVLPRVYVLPKIHKSNCPFRLIVASIDSPLYALATFIHDVISKNVPKSVYNINNSFQLVKRLNGTRFGIEHICFHKDILPREKRKNVVYKISCKSCDASYVGQTKRKLKTRLAEHRNHINWNSNNQSVITEHRIEFDHDFDWENVAILDEKRPLNKWLISECLHILMQQNSLNLRSDTEGVHHNYIQLIKDIK